jgi:acetyl-CoA carboxylase biotin carboxyl carrier protein
MGTRSEPVLLARIERGRDGLLRVLAPKIGFWCDPPERGMLLGPGSAIGTLAQLNRRFRLVLPDGAAGHVEDGVTRHRRTAVEHGQLLLALRPAALADDARGAAAGASGAGEPGGASLAPGLRAIRAPTDGVFYRRASPDAEPFVREGQRLRRGEPVGLVEVMKTFNQVLYDLPGAPDEVEVVELRGGEACEVRAGEILVVVREGTAQPAPPLAGAPPEA